MHFFVCWDFSWFIVPQDPRPFLTCSSTLSFTPFSFCGLLVIQDPVVVIIPMTRRSFSRLSIKRDLNHSKAWWKIHHMQFIEAQVMDQDLDRVTFPFPVVLKGNTNSYASFGNHYFIPSGVKYSNSILAGAYSFSPDEVEVFQLI